MDFSSVNIIVFIVLLLISVGVHEAMHAFAANWLGDTTARDMGRLTLNPLKHLDLYTSIIMPVFLVLLGLPPFFAAKPVPFNPARVKFEEFGAALVGIAGPLTNLSLAVLTAGLLRLIGANLSYEVAKIWVVFVQLNIALFVFNMIPFPPLDGSRLLYALAPEPLQKVMYQIESMGFAAIIIFIFVFFPLLGPLVINMNNHIVNVLLS